MRLSFSILALTSLILGGAEGCHRNSPPPPAHGGECSAKIADVARTPSPPVALTPPERSVIPVLVRASLPHARALLEAQAPKRLAAETNHSIGAAGKLTYTVDRGPFAVSLKAGVIVAETDLTVSASVCKDVYALGCVKYGSCSPLLHVVATLPTQLKDDFSFAPSTMRVDVTRRCLMTALDIDVTDFIEIEADKQARKVKAKIDAGLPKPKAEVERAWKSAQTSLPMSKGACVFLHPAELTQGPTTIERAIASDPKSEEQIVARFGIVATPGVDVPCPPDPPPAPLPKLVQAPKPSDAFAIHLPVRVSTKTLEATWGKTLDGAKFEAGASVTTAPPALVTRATFLEFDTPISGEACGRVLLSGTPGWDDTAKQLRFDTLDALSDEQKRVNAAAPMVDLARLTQGVRPLLLYKPPTDDVAFVKTLSVATSLVSEKDREIVLAVTKSGIEGAPLVGPDGVELRFFLEGTAALLVH